MGCGTQLIARLRHRTWKSDYGKPRGSQSSNRVLGRKALGGNRRERSMQKRCGQGKKNHTGLPWKEKEKVAHRKVREFQDDQ